jgi:hypothetical protein
MAITAVSKPLTSAEVGPAWISASRPALQTVSATRQRFTMKWNATIGATYNIEYSDAMGTWKPIAQPVTATNPVQTWTDDGAQTGGLPTKGSRLYRLQQMP